jgi:hypothetical protein
MGRVAVDFGVGQGAKRSADIRSDLGQASNAGQRQNQCNRQRREVEGQLAASLGRYSPQGDAPSSLLAIRPSTSTRGPSQFFKSLLGFGSLLGVSQQGFFSTLPLALHR